MLTFVTNKKPNSSIGIINPKISWFFSKSGIKKFIPFLFLAFAYIFFSANTFAQSGANDPTFNPSDLGFGYGDGASGNVFATAIQSDGKIIIGGSFIAYNGAESYKIARLNTDGSMDASFILGQGANANVLAIAIQSDGKIIIGGVFTSYNGIGRNYIARLNTNGSLDATFIVGTGLSGYVNAIAIQSDGKIIIGGEFTNYNGTARNRITRLNSDGSLDATFNVGTGLNGYVNATAIQSDGKIIIGGGFTSYNGTAINRIARLNTDGSLDATFILSTGANSNVLSTVIQSDGKIIIGGLFTTYNGTAINRIARLNTNGSLDATFIVGTGANSDVRATAIQSDQKIIIGGDFTSYNGTGRNYIARLNTSGSLDITFIGGSGLNGYINATAIQSDGKIIIGGDFTSYNGTAINHIARLNTDGSLDTTFDVGTGTNAFVYTMAIQSDGKIIIGGNFNTYNGIGRNYIARLNTDGTLDVTFNIGTGTSFVYTTAIQSDGKIIIGGVFTSYNGTAINRIARLNTDGSLDATFNVGTGANNIVYTTAIQSDGKIIIGGVFTSYNGTARNQIARLNTDGSLDATFIVGTGFNGYVHTAAIQSDGKIIIGGNFNTYNGTASNYIARLNTDGSLDATFNIGTGTNNIVFTIAIQSDEKIIIGGVFTSYNGTARNQIARLNTGGSLDVTFNIGTGANDIVRTTAIQSDGKIIIGGFFTSYNGIGRNRVARIIGNSCTNPNVPILLASTTTICLSSSSTLSVATGTLNDATNWQWYSASCGGTSVGSGTNIVVSPTVTTTYYARGEGGCVSPSVCANITITVNIAPTISINSGAICAGQSFTMVPTGAVTYTYSNGSSIATPTANATYTVNGTDANGCASNGDAVASVTVNALPTVLAVTNNTLLCTGETATLTVSGTATTYTWSTTDNTTTVAVSPTVQTTYTVDGTDGNGCKNTTTVTQDVSLCTGIATLSNDAKTKLYPNPNNGLFVIELTTLSKVTVTNALGQVVIAETFEAGKHTVNINNESTGVYFVKVMTNNKQQIIKVIKE